MKYIFVHLVICILFTSGSLMAQSLKINIVDRGAKGDGIFDNWLIFQKAVDELANKGGGTIFVPIGDFAIYNKSLVLWGSNIRLEGENKNSSKIIKKGVVGYFGECIDIAGKIKGYKYYGDFGKGDYKRLKEYTGKTESAKNITINNIHITSEITKGSTHAHRGNNLGIINSENVKISNCILTNANQTNAGVVNEINKTKNGTVIFENCIFRNPGAHNVRVISYNQGKFVGNKVSFLNCRFEGVKNKEIYNKEIVGKKVNLWYRSFGDSDDISLSIDKCFFDDSGIIVTTQNANNLIIKNSEIHSYIEIIHSPRSLIEPKINISDNSFSEKDFFAKSVGFGESIGVRFYPQNLTKKSTVTFNRNRSNNER